MLSLVDLKKPFIGNIFKYRRVINLPWGRNKQTANRQTENADIKIARHVLFSVLNT